MGKAGKGRVGGGEREGGKEGEMGRGWASMVSSDLEI